MPDGKEAPDRKRDGYNGVADIQQHRPQRRRIVIDFAAHGVTVYKCIQDVLRALAQHYRIAEIARIAPVYGSGGEIEIAAGISHLP